jgi:hypothetical protein
MSSEISGLFEKSHSIYRPIPKIDITLFKNENPSWVNGFGEV